MLFLLRRLLAALCDLCFFLTHVTSRGFIGSIFRRTFIWYDRLPVRVHPETGVESDELMAETAAEACERAKELHFPDTFLFGTATAAYQVEGGLDKCTWREWEKKRVRADGFPTIERHEEAGIACDHWGRFEADLAMMKRIGVRMYRFSVDWSRCEPEEGRWSDAALARYVRWCELLREAGIEPMVTLHHFNEPTWFDAKGGWEVRANLDDFKRFAERVAAALAPHCGHWATINELNGCAALQTSRQHQPFDPRAAAGTR